MSIIRYFETENSEAYASNILLRIFGIPEKNELDSIVNVEKVSVIDANFSINIPYTKNNYFLIYLNHLNFALCMLVK